MISVYNRSKRFTLPALALLCGVCSGNRASARPPDAGIVLDAFDDRNDAAARTRWQARESTPHPRLDADGGLVFEIPFGSRRSADRFVWDREVRLDLSTYTTLTLDLDVTHSEAVRSLALYLKSGDGWYVWNRPLSRSGRQLLSMDRDNFATEGTPAGWNRIERIRLSPWRGTQALDARLHVFGMRALTRPVIVLRGTQSPPDEGERNAARRAATYLARRLTALGVPHAVIDEEWLVPEMPAATDVIILPYNPVLPDSLHERLELHIGRGAKIMVFYSADTRLAESMGFELGDYRVAETPLQWNAFTFNEPGKWRVPSRVLQNSANILTILPVRRDAEIIAWWEDALGENSGDPAWGISQTGTWMTHILLPGDDISKENLLAGILTRWQPDLWPGIVEATMARSDRIGSYDTRRQAAEAILDKSRALPPAARRAVEAKIELAGQCHVRAQHARQNEDYEQAFSLARATRRLLVEAKAMVHIKPAYPGEFRGIWDHHAFGWYPGNWRRSAAELQQSGITAVLPNVAWAGLAHYDSGTLPHSALYNRFGDQLAAAREATTAHGLELHAWIVCWKLGQTTAAFLENMRREDRLQRDAHGNELPWLCPSHPENLSHMLQIIHEVAAYRPDGIHLDYIRFPGPQACYCNTCRRQVESRLGRALPAWPAEVLPGGPDRDAWEQHRVAAINALVSQAHAKIKGIDENIALSAAVFGNYPGTVRSIGQDWGAWTQAGMLDFVAPMNYTDDTAEFIRWITRQKAGPASGSRLITGIGVSSDTAPLTEDQALEQVAAARRLGAAGYILFALDHALREQVLPVLRPDTGLSDRADDM